MQTLRQGVSTLLAVLALVASDPSLAWKPEVGDLPQAPDAYEYVDGSEISLAQLKGKPTVLYIGGDWCPPCLETRPHVLRLVKDLPGKVNVVFFSADDNRDRPGKLSEQKASDYKIAMPRLSLYPPGNRPKGTPEIGEFGRIYIFPTAFVLDAEGRVVRKYERGAGIRGDLRTYVTSMVR